jgi:hypothetical protein
MNDIISVPVDTGHARPVPEQVREIPDMFDVYTYRISMNAKVGDNFRVMFVDASGFEEARAVAGLLAGAANTVLEVTQLPNGAPIDLVHTSTLVVKTNVYSEHTPEFHAEMCHQ